MSSTQDSARKLFEQDKNDILKCKKDQPKELYTTEYMDEFSKRLFSYVYKKLRAKSFAPDERLLKYLRGGGPDLEYDALLKRRSNIELSGVQFPPKGGEFMDTLNQLGNIEFLDCGFYCTNMNLFNVDHTFEKCTFFDQWTVSRSILDHTIPGAKVKNDHEYRTSRYIVCDFNKDLVLKGDSERRLELEVSFQHCHYFGNIHLEYVTLQSLLFDNRANLGIENQSLEIKINECIFQKRLVLNDSVLKKFEMSNSKVDSKFEFKNNTIEKFNIHNSNFSEVVDFFETKFRNFELTRSIFKNFAGFERCTFGFENSDQNRQEDGELIAKFEYVTFLDFINFRDAGFQSGLNLDYINITEPHKSNFIGINIDDKRSNTTRETYRIIKNSFEEVRNYIEANKYFALEMKKRKEGEVSKQEGFVLGFNDWVSDFGQSWTKALRRFLALNFIFGIIVLMHNWERVHGTVFDWRFDCSVIIVINKFFSLFVPFESDLLHGMELISLLFYFANSVLIWQIIVAVKRCTKR